MFRGMLENGCRNLRLISRREGIHVITGPEIQFATTGERGKKHGVKEITFCTYTDGLVGTCAQAIKNNVGKEGEK